MSGEVLEGHIWGGRDHDCCFRLDESWVFERIIVTGVVSLLGYSAGVGLSRSRTTSGIHHLSPNLCPRPTLSVVGTCWRAKGLMGAMALLKAAG